MKEGFAKQLRLYTLIPTFLEKTENLKILSSTSTIANIGADPQEHVEEPWTQNWPSSESLPD
jgi:hypothetical protein